MDRLNETQVADILFDNYTNFNILAILADFLTKSEIEELKETSKYYEDYYLDEIFKTFMRDQLYKIDREYYDDIFDYIDTDNLYFDEDSYFEVFYTERCVENIYKVNELLAKLEKYKN